MNGLTIPGGCKPDTRPNRTLGGALAIGLFALSMAGNASAGCTNFGLPAHPAASGAFTNTFYGPGAAGTFGFVPVQFSAAQQAAIVGLWKVEFLAKGNSAIPDGALIDYGTATWTSDGTETMVSGGRQPANGDVCMGAWKQTGRSSYFLNHLAMAYDGGAYVGPTSIKEWVTLDPAGNSFHGHFTITAYLATQVPGHEFDENTILAPTPIVGTITGMRVTAN